MTLEDFGLYAVAFCLLVGAIFSLVGSIGLVKFNGAMTRLHAPTKVGTVGIGALLLASTILSFVRGEGSVHELMIMVFLFVTAPISAHFIAKVHMHKASCEQPPAPSTDETWATLDVSDDHKVWAEQKG